MTFRSRITLAFVFAAVLPIVLLAVGVRREMTAQLDRQAERRVGAVLQMIQAEIEADATETRARLRSLGNELRADNRFRLAIRGGEGERRWLLDWAESVMPPSGLAVLQLRDSAGRILSSGHFRNEYDRVDPGMPALLSTTGGGRALVTVRGPEGPVLALAGLDSLRVGGHRFTLVGGTVVDSARLAALGAGDDIRVVLAPPDSTPRDAVAEIELLWLAEDADRPGTIRLVVTRDPAPLRALRDGVDRWFGAALLLTVVLALSLSIWLATRVSRPVAELAAKTARLDLDRLDQDFQTERQDEVGSLSRLLDSMTQRLRISAARLREAERRAATGDLARQINHDVKNGLAPIRHVLRHWSQVAEREPERLAAVYRERRGTVESSLDYLDALARNYARLAPVPDLVPSDVNALLVEVARAARSERCRVEVRPGSAIPPVRADPVVFRRILENLVANAVEAVEDGGGQVTLASDVVQDGSEPRVQITVTDTGGGMSREELDRIFEDFYTTKVGGTGLGLSVVRRLVADLGGTLRVETAPGRGTRFNVEIPAA